MKTTQPAISHPNLSSAHHAPKLQIDVGSLSTVAAVEAAAGQMMSPEMLQYTQKTAGTGQTHRNNLTAYAQYGISPSVLSGIESAHADTMILGAKVSSPIMLAPTPWHRLFNEGGELATLLAARRFGTNFILSCFSGSDFSDLQNQTEHEQKLKNVWYQLLLHKDIGVMQNYMDRAAAAGCGAIVLSVDAPAGCRMCSVEGNSSAPRIGLPPDQLPLLPVASGSHFDTLDAFYQGSLDPKTANWKYVEQLTQNTKLPVVLKGILREADLKAAQDIGVAGVIVSNHGGRQLDGAVSTLEALKRINEETLRRTSMEVYMDGGIRCGADIFKACAFGAKAVLIGRPTLYGLAVGGQHGVHRVLNILAAEFAQCMLLAGCKTVADISRDKVVAL